jgi:hypothetical protein
MSIRLALIPGLTVILFATLEVHAQKDPKPPALADLMYAKNLAYSNDGSLVLIDYGTGPNPTKGVGLGIWDTKTGEFRKGMEKSNHHWQRVALSDDNKKVAAIDVAGRELKIWNAESGKLDEEQTLPEWKGSVYGASFLKFTPDGTTLYATWDKQLLEAKVGGKSRLLSVKLGLVNPNEMSFNPQTRQFIFLHNTQGQKKCEIFIHDLSKDDAEPQKVITLDDQLQSLAISHDGKTMALSYIRGGGKPRFELWDTDGWKLRTTLPQDQRKGFSAYSILTFAPDDKSIAGAPVFEKRGDKDVDFLDLDGKLLHEFTHKVFPEWMVFSPDGKTLAVKLLDVKDTVIFVDPATGEAKKP